MVKLGKPEMTGCTESLRLPVVPFFFINERSPMLHFAVNQLQDISGHNDTFI